MTAQQYKEYSEKLEEIQTIKSFLECGCGCAYNKFLQRFPFCLIVKERHERKLFLFRKWHLASHTENEFEIPSDLQREIIKTMEKWMGEKEKELEGI